MTAAWQIRAATADDAPLLGQLLVQGWRDSYGGLVDQNYLDTLTDEGQADRWRKRFADDSARVDIAFDAQGAAAGFVGYGRLRTPLPGQSAIRPLYSGEIYAIYILSAYWRQGLGRTLMRDAAEGLAAMKHKSMCLWVLDGNKRAFEFYRTMGGERCGKQDVDIGGGRHKEICFGWRKTENLRAALG